MGLHPLLVPGSAQNFKVTYPEDFALADALLNARSGGSFPALSSHDSPGKTQGF
jgi:hypothetical protein